MHILKSAGSLRAVAFFVILLIALMSTPQWALSAVNGQPRRAPSGPRVDAPNTTVTVIDTAITQS